MPMLTRSRARHVECAICLEICYDNIGRIQCSHNYCFKCIREWTAVKNRCPTCKRKISKIVKLSAVKLKEKSRKLKCIEPETVSIYSQSASQYSSESEGMSDFVEHHPSEEIVFLTYHQQDELLAQIRMFNALAGTVPNPNP